eukprot:tig00021603_g22807.t1
MQLTFVYRAAGELPADRRTAWEELLTGQLRRFRKLGSAASRRFVEGMVY